MVVAQDSSAGPQRCDRCGQPLETGARFCGECGTPVHEPSGDERPRRGGSTSTPRVRRLVIGGVFSILVLAAVVATNVLPVEPTSPNGGEASPVSTPPGEPTAEPSWDDSWEQELPDPWTVTLPGLDEDAAERTRSHLSTEEGRLLVDFHEASQPLLELDIEDVEAAARGCHELVEDTFVHIVEDPDELMVVATEVPEENTAMMAMNAVAAAREFLAVCLSGDHPEEAATLRDEARFTHVVFQRRLTQLEVPR